MQYADTKIYFKNAFKASLLYSFICKQAPPPHSNTANHITMTSEKANTLRYNAARLSVPDELHWYNNHTNWDTLSRKEFREIMIRMETITAQYYNDFGDCTYGSRCNRSSAIKQFWADEWDCEYLPESGKWLNLSTYDIIKSETEKKAERDAKKASKKAITKASKEALNNQYNDEEEEEVYVQAAQKQQKQTQPQQKQPQQAYDYDAWFDAEEEAYAEAYAQARAQEDQGAQQAEAQKAQAEAQTYLDSFTYLEEEEKPAVQAAPTTRITCQAVLYLEELTEVQGDPDWRAYIYYDARIRRFVFKGTRRSLRATSKKTVFPEIKLCFRSSRELAHYLCSSTDALLNVSMYAMSSATVKDATFAELYALPARGSKTELFGYDETRPRFSTFVNYLCMVRDIDAAHSTFASF
jgi:hypothetical protein